MHMLSPEEHRVIESYRARDRKDSPSKLRATPGWIDETGGSRQGASFVLPEAHAGTVIDSDFESLPALSFEFFRVEIPRAGNFSLSPGAAYLDGRSKLFVALDRKFPSLCGIEAGPFASYDPIDKDVSFGLHVVGLRW